MVNGYNGKQGKQWQNGLQFARRDMGFSLKGLGKMAQTREGNIWHAANISKVERSCNPQVMLLKRYAETIGCRLEIKLVNDATGFVYTLNFDPHDYGTSDQDAGATF